MEENDDEYNDDKKMEIGQFPNDLNCSIPIETTSHEPENESNVLTENNESLVGISEDREINNDVKFLGEQSKVFDACETSSHLETI